MALKEVWTFTFRVFRVENLGVYCKFSGNEIS